MANVPSRVIELVETFDRNIETYKKQPYNEAQVRSEFIDPFFEELGWDITNKGGLAQAYKDVIHEDAIKIGGYTKAPDYCFRIGGTRKFFLEAKKPSIDIKADPHPAYQLRRYAWSAKLPLSILTDFEEFAVYDCQIVPKQTDRASTARIQYFNYKDYIKKWDEIAKVFSKDAILKGSFDKFAAETKGKRGTTTVDKEFLTELEKWRRELARIIALRNRDLSIQQINFAVQRTIDRIIFLRMAEDRGIETYGQLLGLSSGTSTYPRLCSVFEQADHKYNSGLFHFQHEKGRTEPPDELTLNLLIDDKDLKWILHNLYYPQCPYEFSVLPPEILGNVYEQFLGKVITLSPAHRATVEDKPEVKKAGGIYYTPTYIVDYIVKNTVGKLLGDPSCHSERSEESQPNNRKSKIVNRKSLTPKQVENLRILDPACGSGSFLLGAYTYLLNYHRDWYVDNNPEKHTKQIYQGKGGQWFLTIAEKKKILLNNIFGVDIDSQAVEVTKLSLLLKVLEGESAETIGQTYKMFHERALPDLGNNIKCGNSLIGPDFFDDYQRLAPAPVAGVSYDPSILDELYQKINPFDWQKEFPQIFKRQTSKRSPDAPQAGGFNAIIGNPPYIPTEEIPDRDKKYFKNKHPQLERKYDTSIVFILSMLQKLKSNGLLSFISSVTWQTGENYKKLREYLFTQRGVKNLVNLPFDVFKKAYVDTGIYILSKKASDGYLLYRFPKKAPSPNMEDIKYTTVPTKLILAPDYKIVLDPCAQNILQRAKSNPKFVPLGAFTFSTQGLALGKYNISPEPEGDNWYPIFMEGKTHRYRLEINKASYADMNDHSSLKRFYESQPKILIRRIVNRQDRLMATYCDEKLVFKKDINPFIINSPPWNPHFVLGVLNSKLISYLYINTSSIATKDDFRQTTLSELRSLPIPSISVQDVEQKAKHNKMVKFVERMLDLHKKLAAAKVPAEKTRIQRQITTTDNQIDKLVYLLYDLTPEEIAIVEEK